MRKRNLWKKSASVLIAAAMIMTSVPVYAGTSDEAEDEVVIVQEFMDEAEDEAVEILLEEEGEKEQQNKPEIQEDINTDEEKTGETQQYDYWQDKVSTKPDGFIINSEQNTISISSPEGLAWLGRQINSGTSYANYTITIINDLDMSQYYWIPIDTSTISYNESNGKWETIAPNKKLNNAVIDGNGHLIEGLKTNTGIRGANVGSQPGDGQSCFYYSGFIGRNDGNLRIKNITFSSADISIQENGVDKAGASSLAVLCGFSCKDTELNFEKVNIENSKVTGYTKVGGFVGQDSSKLTLEKCSVIDCIFNLTGYINSNGELEFPAFSSPISGYVMRYYPTLKGVKISGNQCQVPQSENTKVITQGDRTWYLINYGTNEEPAWYSYYAEHDFIANTPSIEIEGKSYSIHGVDYAPCVSLPSGDIYTNLNDAINDAQGEVTIKLLQDIYLTAQAVIPEEKIVTLDLNGNNITVKQENGRSLYAIDNKGTFTLMDSSTEKTGAITARGVENMGTMTLDSGAIYSCDSNGGGAAIWNEGNLTMTGGKLAFTGSQYDGSAGMPLNNVKGTATITGGQFESPYTSIFVGGGKVDVEGVDIILNNTTKYWHAIKVQGGTANLKDITVNSKCGGGLEAAGGTATLTNCKFTQEGQYDWNSTNIAASNGGTVNVISGEYTSENYGAYVFNSGGTINIQGGTFEAETVFKADDSNTDSKSVINVSDGEFKGSYGIGQSSELKISGGYYTSNPTEYVEKGYIATSTTKPGYLYEVKERTNQDAPVEPAVGEPSVPTKEELKNKLGVGEDIAEKIKESAASVDAPGMVAEAGDIANSIDEDKAEKLIKEATDKGLNVAENQKVTIYAQVFLKVTPESYSANDKEITFKIEPKYQLVASTAQTASEIDLSKDGNAKVVQTAETLEIKEAIEISLQLPDGLVEGKDTPVYIYHTKDDNKTTFIYDATVTEENGKLYITFKNPNGFSLFKASTQDAVASVGNTFYSTLNDALAAAEGKTVRVLKDVTQNENVTLAASKNATLDLNGHTITGTLTNSGTLTITDSSAGKTGTITGDITSNGTTYINAGNFNGTLSTGNNGKFSISGGRFSKEVKNEYCAPGYMPTTFSDGKYGVTTIPSPSYSTNNNLSALSISAGTLTPAFDKNTTSYTAVVDNKIESVTVTPVREDAFATIQVNGTSVTSGTASAPIVLKEGENTITVLVTAESGAQKTYTITVTREKAPVKEPNTDASLSGLTISEGTLSPEFSAENEQYKAVVENAVDSILVTPKTTDEKSTVTVNGKPASEKVALKVGYNTINVVVTAEDGKTTKTYTIQVTRAVPKNKTITISRRKYKVTNELISKASVQITGLSDKKVINLSVPDTVKIYGITYKVTSVGKNAFRGQPKMKTAKIGNNVTTVGYGAFYACPLLNSVTLGTKVKTIGDHVFCRDSKLRTLTLQGTALTKVEKHVLYKVTGLTIKAPSSKVKAYKKLFTNKGAKTFKVVKK